MVRDPSPPTQEEITASREVERLKILLLARANLVERLQGQKAEALAQQREEQRGQGGPRSPDEDAMSANKRQFLVGLDKDIAMASQAIERERVEFDRNQRVR
jgi:hypothetical protein